MRQLLIFVLFTITILVSACSSTDENPLDSLPDGDVTRGKSVFNESISGAPTCSSCHTVDGNVLLAPSLLGYAAVAATRVEDQSAEQYTYTSITRPPAYTVSGFGNTMYNQYGQRLTPQQIADLIAYLLTL